MSFAPTSPHGGDIDVRTVHFKVGMREKAWAKNCLAVGLAGGFIEPLESTGLYLSYLAAIVLHEHFPYRDEDMETMAFRANRIMATRYYEMLDFINMHYCLTKRTDTEFWRDVQRPERIVPRLKAKLDYWKLKPPSGVDFLDQYFPGMPTRTLFASDASDSRLFVDTGGLWNHQSYESHPLRNGLHGRRVSCSGTATIGRNRASLSRSSIGCEPHLRSCRPTMSGSSRSSAWRTTARATMPGARPRKALRRQRHHRARGAVSAHTPAKRLRKTK